MGWTARPLRRTVVYEIVGASTRAGLLRSPSSTVDVASHGSSRYRATLPRDPAIHWVTVLAIAPDGTRIARAQRVRSVRVGFTGQAGP